MVLITPRVPPQALLRRQVSSEITGTRTTTSIPTTTSRSTSLPPTRSSSSSSTSSLSSPSSSSSLSISVPASSTSSVSSGTTSSTSSITATPASESQGSSSGIPKSTLIGATVGGTIGLLLVLTILSILFTACRRRKNDARKRPRFSVVPAGMMPSKSKRPETVYDVDSFLSPKPFHHHNQTAPLLPDGGRPSAAYESLDGVDEHGVVDRYTDRPPSPDSTNSINTARRLVSPYSVDGHGSDEGHQATSTPPAAFSPMPNEQNNGLGFKAATPSPNVPTISPLPSTSPSNLLS